uniref:Expressed protein n=1 Tax=Schizophyllum commune (strain H4-8 / FGSC 9210) TaxID=578458 RepID=D8QF11_SCHCM
MANHTSRWPLTPQIPSPRPPIASTRYTAFASSYRAFRRLKCIISAEPTSSAGSTMPSLMSEW